MKAKKILSIVSLLIVSCVLFAENYLVNVTQNVQIPGGGKYASLPAPSIEYTNLPNGKLNLKYDFSLEAPLETKVSKFISGARDILIDCKIEFPSGVPFVVTSFEGLQSFEFDGEQVPALIEHATYAEFFIPVRTNGSGFIEIQLTIPESYVGSDIPIKVNFEGYKRNAMIGGAVVNVATDAFFYLQTRSAQQIEERFGIVKDNYKKFSLSDSLKRYRVQVR